MQKHRIFIAINLPENIKKKLLEYQNKIDGLFAPYRSIESGNENGTDSRPIRWTKMENLHITLEFIGNVNNDGLVEIMEIAKKIASRHNPFLVKITKVCYGPLDKKPPQPPKFPEIIIEKGEQGQKFRRPRMVWAIGEKSKEFASLRDDLKEALSEFPNNRQNLSVSGKERKFSPHITLGRIRQWEWRRIEPEERPVVEEDINLTFEAKSIEVMESRLKRGGAEYIVLESTQMG